VSDLIQIRSFELLLYCGVLPEEVLRRQPFRFDIDVEVDLQRPSQTDDLADTVDYGEVLETLAKTLQAERFDLLERLAGRAAELVLANPLVSAVTVAAHKLRPPVPHHVASTGVKIRRER
jgi:FolB domain-containing protein